VALSAAAFLLWLLVASGHASAQESLDLSALARDLGSDDASTRHEAAERLQALPAEALPAIAERLTRLRRGRPPAEDAANALTAIRRAAGSRRADDLIDIAPGVEIALETDRSPAMLRVAEPLLLLRSLERLGSTDALRLVPEVLRLDGEPWRMEGRRVTLRMGDRIAAAAIHARSADDNAEGRTWARWTTDRLDLDNPGGLAQRMSSTDLADVLAAYSATHTLAAIPVVASFVDADQRRLREAAREALRGYRQNGIWVARETYETRVGQEPDLAWGWERTLDELYERLDAARSAHIHTALAEATTALDRGDHGGARAALDHALVRAPELATPEAARLYARIAASERDANGRDALLRRALTIAPEAPEAAEWRALLAFDRANAALAAGVLDAESFARAAESAPSCADCAQMAGTLSRQAAMTHVDRTVPYAIAAALFAVLGLLLLTWSTPRARTAAVPTQALVPADETLS
jgi:hypothetical protein